MPNRLRISAIQKALRAWFERAGRDLPWRKTRDPYALWVSEVMLQQTGVKTVIPYYRRFLKRFPTVTSLARAKPDDVLKAWEGLGYYARARNLKRGADFIVNERKGEFPRGFQEWLEVPGVGPATAAALASYLAREPRPVLDGNVRRVISRVYKIRTRGDGKGERNLQTFAAKVVAARDPGLLNQALMDLGATVCRPRSPSCGLCPISSYCGAFAEGQPEKYPGPSRRPRVGFVRVVAAVITRNGKVLITRRPPEGLLGGLWEFPGGKIEEGETPEEALARELREELGIEARIGEEIMCTVHRYTHLKVRLHFYRAEVGKPHIIPGPGCAGWLWVAPDELSRFAFPAADKAIVKWLVKQSRSLKIKKSG